MRLSSFNSLILPSKITLLSILSLFIFFGFVDKKNSNEKIDKIYQATYVLKFNRIEFPFNNLGVLADVAVPPYTSEAKFDGKGVIFSGGFLLGGKIWSGTYREQLWVNGVATSNRIRDYVPGKVGMNPSDPKAKIYIVKSSDEPFSYSWQEWKTAVELGAEFYDGDGDGIYNPVDKNNNGIWDIDEDRPNIIGDFNAWCVYNDGVPKNNRMFNFEPLGIEVHQTIWAYESIPHLKNSIFIRYRFIFRGNDTFRDLTKLDSVIFSFFNDVDIGDYTNDLMGTDTLLNAVYGYNDGNDSEFGVNPPVVFTQLLQGPQVFIPNVTFLDNNNNGIFDTGDTPIKSAKMFIDPIKIISVPGASNLNMTSSNQMYMPLGYEFTHYTFWSWMNGLDHRSNLYNPCTFSFGAVLGGVNCNEVNPKFIYSGDPVTRRGWINIQAYDQRILLNSGRFTLAKDKPVDIIVAYAIGRGTSALNSITETRKFASFNQTFYDINFYKPTTPPYTDLNARITNNSIDIFWRTKNDFEFKDFLTTIYGDTIYNIQFEIYELWAHKTPELYYGQDTTRSKKLATYDIENEIDNIYIIEEDGITVRKIFSKGIQLKPDIYKNPISDIIIYSMDKNPFTGTKLKKGEKLYFSLRKIYLNKTSLNLIPVQNKPGNVLIPVESYSYAVTERASRIFEFTMGESFNQPPFINERAILGSTNATEAKVFFDEIDVSKLTDDLYQISFFRTDTIRYTLNWRLKNLSKNIILLDSQTTYFNKDSVIFIVDGFYPKIEWIEPQVKNVEYKPHSNIWYQNFRTEYSGIFYLGREPINLASRIYPLGSTGEQKSSLTTFDKLRKIEIRFGKTQKAYRFVSNTFNTRYFSAANTSGDATVGKPGQYFVDVPFQVWVKDERFNEERQLACGFIEARSNLGGNPDGNWDPGTNISNTREYIIIFNQSYDSTGRQMEYVGYLPGSIYAELRSGWTPPAEANFTPQQIERAKYPWFDALLVVGLEKLHSDSTFKAGDVLTIPISYPITIRDTFYYQSKSALNKLTVETKKELLNLVSVFPNPYFEWKDQRPYGRGFITFSNLPEEVTIKIYTLSGILVRTLTERNKTTIASPFIQWDLKNEDGYRVADGVYLAHVKTKFGEKVLKFSVVKLKN